jgi:hypothetical protein
MRRHLRLQRIVRLQSRDVYAIKKPMYEVCVFVQDVFLSSFFGPVPTPFIFSIGEFFKRSKPNAPNPEIWIAMTRF